MGCGKTVLTGLERLARVGRFWVSRSLGWYWPEATQEVVVNFITWAECIRGRYVSESGLGNIVSKCLRHCRRMGLRGAKSWAGDPTVLGCYHFSCIHRHLGVGSWLQVAKLHPSR